jgi:hypothetical protein
MKSNLLRAGSPGDGRDNIQGVGEGKNFWQYNLFDKDILPPPYNWGHHNWRKRFLR